MSGTWDDTRRSRLLLGVVFVFRLLFALRFSYLHPDEHMQGPQEIAHGTFGWASQYAWEFEGEHPIRSYVPLWLVYGIPMSFFPADTHPEFVLYTLRIVFFTLTWVLQDMAVDRLASTRRDKLRSLFFVSTSYVTLTWQNHTLSNSFETVLVLWLNVILFESDSKSSAPFMSAFDRHYDSLVGGLIFVLGVFNRPTFIAFVALPCVVYIKQWWRYPGTLLTFAMSCAAFSAICIYTDTLLYGKEDWVVAPLNFVRYNMSSANLSDHGVHSRWTHLLVNIPQLLGPGLLLLRPRFPRRRGSLLSLPWLTIASGLAVLSWFPHQEARFLMPIVPALCIEMDFEQFSSKKVRNFMLYVWLGFNLVLGIVMGVFHQGGVVPAQMQVRDFERPATVVWWKTYPPPLWILGLPSEEVKFVELSIYGVEEAELYEVLSGKADVSHHHHSDAGDAIAAHDGVKEIREAAEALANLTRRDSHQAAENASHVDILTVASLQGADAAVLGTALAKSVPHSPVYVVAPFAVKSALQAQLDANHMNAEPMWNTWFHLDPELLSPSLGLGIWNVTQLL